MDEEEPECAYPKITEACKPNCTTPFAAYEVSGRRRVKKAAREGLWCLAVKLTQFPVFVIMIQ